MSTTSAQAGQTLDRRLGPFDAAAIIVSNVIGGGILFTPPQIAASVPNALLFLAVWAMGGVLAFAGFVLSPAAGAVLMSVSTIVVALNAQLLRRIDLNPERITT